MTWHSDSDVFTIEDVMSVFSFGYRLQVQRQTCHSSHALSHWLKSTKLEHRGPIRGKVTSKFEADKIYLVWRSVVFLELIAHFAALKTWVLKIIFSPCLQNTKDFILLFESVHRKVLKENVNYSIKTLLLMLTLF